MFSITCFDVPSWTHYPSGTWHALLQIHIQPLPLYWDGAGGTFLAVDLLPCPRGTHQQSEGQKSYIHNQRNPDSHPGDSVLFKNLPNFSFNHQTSQAWMQLKHPGIGGQQHLYRGVSCAAVLKTGWQYRLRVIMMLIFCEPMSPLLELILCKSFKRRKMSYMQSCALHSYLK